MSTLNASVTRAGRFLLAGRRAWGAAAPLLAAGALAAGCGSVSGGAGATSGGAAHASAPATPTASASPVPTVSGGPIAAGGVACAGWPASVSNAPLPVSFVPVSAERCVNGVQAIPSKGVWTTATLQRSTGSLAGLVSALRQPAATRQPGTVCPAVAIATPQVVLVNAAGEKVIPRLPAGDCGTTASAVVTALNEISWQPVSVRLVAPVSGATAATSPTATPAAPDSTPNPGGVMQPG